MEPVGLSAYAPGKLIGVPLARIIDRLIACDVALREHGEEHHRELADVLRHCGSSKLQGG